MTARYAASSRYTVEDNNQIATRGPIIPTRYSVYRVKAGDTTEIIASKVLGDFTRWWELADLNPHIKFPLDIQPGMLVRLPA